MRLTRLAGVVALVLFALLAVACSEEGLHGQASLIVLNDTSTDLVIYVDGREAFIVHGNADSTLDDVGGGRHIVEAVDPGGRLIERRTVEISIGEEFYWSIKGR